MSNRPPAMGFIFFTVLMDVLAFGLLIPVAPKLVRELLHGGMGGTEHEAAPYYGALMATFAIMQFACAPLLGALSDRYGRRPVLLFSIFGSALDYIAMALSPALAFLFITRAINGITGASITVCNAYVADVTPPERRAASFGMLGAAFGLGFTLGPLMGGLLGDIDLRLPFYVAAGLASLNWIYGLLVLPESLPPDRRAPVRLGRLNPFSAFRGLADFPVVAWLAPALFLLHCAMTSLHGTWVLFTAQRFGWDASQVGLSLTAVGLSAAAVQGGLARRIIPALGERRSLIIGISIGAAAYAAYGLATEGWMIYATIVLASIGGIASPAAQAIITKAVTPDRQGSVQGSLTSLQSIASIAGPIAGTQVFALATAPGLSPSFAGAPMLLSAALALAGLGVASVGLSRAGR